MRKYFIAGLLVWVPLLVTIFVIKLMVDVVDKSLTLLPKGYRPEQLFGMHVPGLGLVFTLVVVLVTGVLVTNFLGKKLVVLGEKIVDRIPLVRTIYSAVKQVMHTVFSSSGEAFRQVLLVEYPRKGIWSVAFQTSSGLKEGEDVLETDLVTAFIPTTPNPTSGFLLLVPRKDIIELTMSVDEALKMVISLGVVLPPGQKGMGS